MNLRISNKLMAKCIMIIKVYSWQIIINFMDTQMVSVKKRDASSRKVFYNAAGLLNTNYDIFTPSSKKHDSIRNFRKEKNGLQLGKKALLDPCVHQVSSLYFCVGLTFVPNLTPLIRQSS
jgi:hypothetical protein